MASSLLHAALFTVIVLWEGIHSQTCLSSPPSIRHDVTRSEDSEWEAIPEVSNAYRRTIVFDKYTKEWEDVNAVITTRLFDGFFPSQTLRFKRGTLYELTVVNNLGPEAVDNPLSDLIHCPAV